MYKLIKENGYGQPVLLENTETKAYLGLGDVGIEMLHIMEKHIDKDTMPKPADEWNLEIDNELKDELRGLAMKMKKPIRDQKKKASNEINRKMYNKEINAMDVLLGLASYN